MALFDRHPFDALAVAVGGRADTDGLTTSVVCVENTHLAIWRAAILQATNPSARAKAF